MKVLFTSPILEHPAAGGPQLRIENSIKALSLVSELYVISRNCKASMGGDKAEHFYSKFCKEFAYSPSVETSGTSLKSICLRKVRRVKQLLFPKDIDLEHILHFADKHNIEVIWFGYGNISFSLMKKIKQTRPELKLVCDTDSVWSRFLLRELPYEADQKRRAQIENSGREKEQEEQEWVDFCDITTAVSKVDAGYYKSLAKEPDRIKIFSNVIDLNNYKNIPPPPANFKTPCVYLAGTFEPKSAMDKAARWFIEDVFPIIKKQISNIHFYIIGRGSKETLSDINNPSITITGKLSSVLGYLGNADVSIVPLMFESGTRFKILEAGACGVPIVSTTLGAEGIPVEDGKDIIIADEADAFARGVLNILQNNVSNKLAENCLNLVRKHYSVEQLADEASGILNALKSH